MTKEETSEFLNKYKIKISEIFKCNLEDINFYKYYWQDGNKIKQKIEYLSYFKSADKYTDQVHLEIKDNIISSWILMQMPYCCAFALSCNVNINEKYRKKGLGIILNQLRSDIAKKLGYSAIICTDIEQNIPQRKILLKNGWEDIYNIINKRTKNRVYISIKNLY